MQLTKILMVVSWAALAIYLAANVYLGSNVSVKELSHNLQMQGVTESEYLEAMEKHESRSVIKARKAMIPVWNYNNLIYPGLFILAVLLTFIYFKKPSNKALENDAQ